ncbi:putative bifunctional diguanylate cyclase/phosphodiesterase [Vreelandella aquamarina]|uniref:putative bifunctional diguanylate cyclase/phosphodiesterase n=1 Tax=Vreelandella aquamarina TaxID=77097 RepID=UPI00384D05E9
MDVNNRELALQTGLLMLLTTTVIIGGASIVFGVAPGLPQPQALAILPDSSLVILLCGLGLSAVMTNTPRWRKVASVALVTLAIYTLAHNILTGGSGTSWLSGQPRLPSQAAPILVLAAFCLWVGPQGPWQRRVWQTGGVILWLIGCITLAYHAGIAIPAWLPRASDLLPGLLCFSFGLAMMMVSRRIPHLAASLSKAAVAAGIVGVALSMSAWFLISWNQHETTRSEAQNTLASVTTSIERTLTSRAIVLERLAERWQGVFEDEASRQREVTRYWNDYPSILALAYFNPLPRDVWRRAQQGRDLLWLDDQLVSLPVLRWLNQQQQSVQWLFPDPERPNLALLALKPSTEQRYQLVAVIDIAYLMAKETHIAEQAFSLSIHHPGGHILSSDTVLDAQETVQESTPLSVQHLGLPGGTALHLSLWPRSSSAFELANFIAAGIGIAGLLLTYQLVLSFALIAARAQRTQELAKAKEALEDQHRIQAMIARDEPCSATLLQICRLLEQQNPYCHAAIWRLDNSAAYRVELLSCSLPFTLQESMPFNESVITLASELHQQGETTASLTIDTSSSMTFSQLAAQYGYANATVHILSSGDVLPLGAVVLLAKQEQPLTEARAPYIEPSLLHSALRLMRLAIERYNHQQTLQDSEQRFRSLFTQNPDGVFSLDVDGYFLSVNQSLLTLLAISEADIIGTHFYTMLPTEQRSSINEVFSQALTGVSQRFEIEITSHAGHTHYVDISFLPTVVMDNVVGVYGVVKEMTALRFNEAQLRIFQRSLEASSNGVLICEAQSDDFPIIYVNPAFVEITGYDLADVQHRNCRFLQGPDTDPQQVQDIRQALLQQRDISLTIRNYRKDGRAFWNNIFISPVRAQDGQATHFVGIINDISERKDHENALAYHATHDALTGLGNRALFEDRLNHDVDLAKRHQQQLAVLFIDLDEFKPINDTLGHAIGDQVLIHVARRLEEVIRPSDTLCRFGGDEFVLLLPDLDAPHHAQEVAERLLLELAQPYRIDRHELYLSASIGIALSNEALENPAALLQQADMAMYKAKQQGRNTLQTFTHDINQKLTQRVTLRNDLQEAITQEQFELHYQPLLGRDGSVQGFEALVRWNHPVKGPISPALFIPIAEETGQIIGLSQWVMERAAKDFLKLQPLLPSHCRMAVNLSPMQFHRPSFLSSLRKTLEVTGLPPTALELELTEGILMNDTDAAIDTLHALRGMGISIAIDDFGTGFSSLSYLRHLPIDKIKIDRSFILNIDESSKDAAVVQGIIALAHHLELNVVAESVETSSQQHQLLALNCDVLQGYLFAKPMPYESLTRWLQDHTATLG